MILRSGARALDTKLKTDLVVSFPGSAVADCGSALFAGDLNQLFGD